MHQGPPPLIALDQALDGLTIALASHRLTRLLIEDEIWGTTRIRLRNFLRAHGASGSLVLLTDNPKVVGKRYTARQLLPGKAADALACKLCAGVWVTGATAAAWHYGGRRTRSAIRVCAIIGAQSVLATRT